jgi:hypothetical protein
MGLSSKAVCKKVDRKRNPPATHFADVQILPGMELRFLDLHGWIWLILTGPYSERFWLEY